MRSCVFPSVLSGVRVVSTENSIEAALLSSYPLYTKASSTLG